MLKMFRKSLNNRKGFTLIELLVVVAIIGILAAIAVPKFASANETARGAKVAADLRTIDSSSQIHYAQKGSYPADVAALVTANLLASSPVAPTVGDKFTINGHTFTAAGGYTVDQTTGRALYGTITVEKLIDGTGTPK